MRFWVGVPMVNVVKYKFEVGSMYFTDIALLNRKTNKVGWFKRYWKCVKFNPRTGYVSFVRMYKDNGRWIELENISRKVDNDWDWEDTKRVNGYEVVRITNHSTNTTYVIRADNVVKTR